ncbi:MAG TPA: hypothetical protein VN132_06450, partial [Bdellovibrio sp.]|nr:hypothetical protein [Bdellovibrio sp.]
MALKLTTLALIFFCLPQALWAVEHVHCQQNSQGWFVTNAQGKIVGSDYGFDNRDMCKETANTQTGNLVCTWNGKGYQAYNVETNAALGDADISHHFDEVSECHNMIQKQKKDSQFACAWSGHYYIPYNRADNTPTSNDNTGWEKSEECVSDAVNTSYKDLVCGWVGETALINGEGEIISKDFKAYDECKSLLNILRSANANTKIINGISSETTEAFQNGNPNEKIGFPQKSCEVKADRYHLTKTDKNGYITSECTPEILYSWGGFDKLEWYIDNLGTKKSWPQKLPRSLYTVPSAAATFGYGQISLRFKIKKDVKFKLLRNPSTNDCNGLVSAHLAKTSEFDNTIFARLNIDDGLSFLEFILCSSSPIESWSFGRPENYDEILRDYNWMTTQNYYQWEAYSKQNGVDVFLNSN